MFSCCTTILGKKPDAESVQRQGLLPNNHHQNEVKEDEDATPPVDLRRIFSRTDISGIPENSEINRGAETHHPQEQASSIQGSSPSMPGAPRELERLFSRGAGRNSPVQLNRLFSRGAVVRKSSNLSGIWNTSNRDIRTSTTDSQNEDYGEDRIETILDANSQNVSPLLSSKQLLGTDKEGSILGIQSRGAATSASATAASSSSSTAQSLTTSVYTAIRKPVIQRGKFRELDEALRRISNMADHFVVANARANTDDREDHTYSGIYFDIKARTLVPYHFVEIQSISIRGRLGLLSIYTAEGSYHGKEHNPEKWRRHFGPRDLPDSEHIFREIDLDIPIRMSPGMEIAIYMHSELPGDKAIVYANQRTPSHTYQDCIIRILHGTAHVTNVPFAPTSQWGSSALRRNREFVGSIRYGVRPMMWTPEVHLHFPSSFRQAVFTLLCCQSQKSCSGGKSYLRLLPQDVLFIIINMLPPDWFTPILPEDFSDDDLIAPQLFTYKGNVGSIAATRLMFDEAREKNLSAVDKELASVQAATKDAIQSLPEVEKELVSATEHELAAEGANGLSVGRAVSAKKAPAVDEIDGSQNKRKQDNLTDQDGINEDSTPAKYKSSSSN